MSARLRHSPGHEDAHLAHPFQRHECLVRRHRDFHLSLDLSAEIAQCPSRCRQRTQLIDDHIAVAVHCIPAAVVVFAAADRDPDFIARTQKVIVLRSPESWRRGGPGGGENLVAEEAQRLAGTPAEGILQRIALIVRLAEGGPALELLPVGDGACRNAIQA